MTVNDLPEKLRHLGGQPYNGEKVHVVVNEKWCQRMEPMLLERYLEKERKLNESA